MGAWIRWRIAAVAMLLLTCTVALPARAGQGRGRTATTSDGDARNIRFDGSAGGVVTITYDLLASDPRATFAVTIEVSQDGGITFTALPQSTSGDVGANVTPGSDKRIIWDSAKDTERLVLDRLRFRIVVNHVEPTVGAASKNSGAPTAGALRVTSQPPGATVTIDGQVRGTTPLSLGDVSIGNHRLVITASGYLEKSRVIVVTAGRSTQVEMELTPDPRGPNSTATKQTGGSGKKKWGLLAGGGGAGAVIAAAAAGGSSPVPSPSPGPIPTPTPNRNPSSPTISVVPDGVALATVTKLTFSASSSDPDGDPLTYQWNFGDGGGASGATADHIFPSPSSFTVVVTVSDNRGGSATGTRSVTGAVVTGTWTFLSETWTITQAGPSVSGQWRRPDLNGNAAILVTGTLTDPRSARFVVIPPGFTSVTYTGTFNAAGTQMTGVASGYAGGDLPFTLVKR